MSAPHTVSLERLDDSAGLTDCPGILCGSAAADIRENGGTRPDTTVIRSTRPMAAAGVFTTNDVFAAPVGLCREILATSGSVGGCVANSGNANACTGAEGWADARAMIDLAAHSNGSAAPFLVCSTGRIGRRLPMAKVRDGILRAASSAAASREAGLASADAILTSDTRRKVATFRIHHGGTVFTVAGMAKGAGMIEPNMATMLGFLATDLDLEPARLHAILTAASDRTFNKITIDGDMSTNDTVLLFSTAASGVRPLHGDALETAFAEAVYRICAILAEKIVGDGEKITKVIELEVSGAPSAEAASRVARAIANSLLVKSSWFGSDPNWGRLVDAAGYARTGLRIDLLDLFYDDCPVLLAGVPQDQHLPRWKQIVAGRRFSIRLDLHLGHGSERLLTTDLSEAYVHFNKSE